MKAIMNMPRFFLQKSSKESQSEDYLKALELQIKPWQSGNLRTYFGRASLFREICV